MGRIRGKIIVYQIIEINQAEFGAIVRYITLLAICSAVFSSFIFSSDSWQSGGSRLSDFITSILKINHIRQKCQLELASSIFLWFKSFNSNLIHSNSDCDASKKYSKKIASNNTRLFDFEKTSKSSGCPISISTHDRRSRLHVEIYCTTWYSGRSIFRFFNSYMRQPKP